jgi:hypothetical protein
MLHCCLPACLPACLLVHPACNATTLNYKDKTYLHGRTVVDWTGTSLAFTKSRSWSRSLICTRYRIGLKVRISEAQAIWLIGVEHEQAHTHTRRLCLVSSSLDFWWPIIGKDTPHITRLNIKNHSGVGGGERCGFFSSSSFSSSFRQTTCYFPRLLNEEEDEAERSRIGKETRCNSRIASNLSKSLR